MFKSYNVPVLFDPDEQEQIEGWLILVAIGLTVTPLRFATISLIRQNIFDSNVWNNLIDIDTSTRNLPIRIPYFIFSKRVKKTFVKKTKKHKEYSTRSASLRTTKQI